MGQQPNRDCSLCHLMTLKGSRAHNKVSWLEHKHIRCSIQSYDSSHQLHLGPCSQREKRGPTEIQSTDANVTRDCLKSSTCNHHGHIKNLTVSLSNILKTHTSLQINLGWLSATKGSIPLCQLKSIAAETACQGPTMPPLPPTEAQLHSIAW